VPKVLKTMQTLQDSQVTSMDEVPKEKTEEQSLVVNRVLCFSAQKEYHV
jgi:hypothetical protein